MLLPITFGLDPTSALIMLSGIHDGAHHGGSTTAILVNLPGESSSVAIDVYAVARKSRASPALATAAIGFFVAGTLTTILIVLFSPVLASLALRSSPAEYVSLMLLGLIASIVLANGGLLHAVGQQRRRPNLLHPHAHARHPVEPRYGADDRRHDQLSPRQ